MAKKKARRKSRKRANTLAEVQSQLRRFNKLLDDWINKSVIASRKVDQYRKKVSYYQGRLDELEAAAAARLLAELDNVRHLRNITLD